MWDFQTKEKASFNPWRIIQCKYIIKANTDFFVNSDHWPITHLNIHIHRNVLIKTS